MTEEDALLASVMRKTLGTRHGYIHVVRYPGGSFLNLEVDVIDLTEDERLLVEHLAGDELTIEGRERTDGARGSA